MPQISLTPENKVESPNDFPKLKLIYGERARIVVLEKDPTFEYVHTIRAPKILNGVVQMKMEKQRDNTEKEVIDFDFISRPRCIGDYGTVAKRGSDPDNCPACKAAQESDALRAPERRLGVHVFKYMVQPGGHIVQEPFGGQVQAWIFADAVFNKLVDIQTEWGPLQTHDINLGPCTQAMYQKFEIQVAATAEWLANDQRRNYVAEMYKSSRSADISALIARKVGRDYIEEDIKKALERYHVAFGSQTTVPTATVGAADIGDLLGGSAQTATPAAPAPDPTANLDVSDLLGGDLPASFTPAPAAPAQPAPEPTVDDVLAAAGPVQPAEKTETLDFDDLLNI
jgi:hypothetical protein